MLMGQYGAKARVNISESSYGSKIELNHKEIKGRKIVVARELLKFMVQQGWIKPSEIVWYAAQIDPKKDLQNYHGIRVQNNGTETFIEAPEMIIKFTPKR